jgi:hypothetical protein
MDSDFIGWSRSIHKSLDWFFIGYGLVFSKEWVSWDGLGFHQDWASVFYKGSGLVSLDTSFFNGYWNCLSLAGFIQFRVK